MQKTSLTQPRTWSIVLLVGLVFLVVAQLLANGVVYAQDGEQEVAVAATSTELIQLATTTPATVPATPVTQEPWYRIQNLGGPALGDFVVGPGKIELELQPGQSVTHNISLSNRIEGDARRFKIQVEDIAGSARGDQAVVLLGDDRGPYSLRDYVSTPDDTLVLDSGTRAVIPVTITIPEDAEPGGYYGSVLFSTVQRDGSAETIGAASSPIVARIGTLFFVTVPGEANEQGELIDFTTIPDRWVYASGPITFGITFENLGTKHLNPYGELRITNMLGEEVGYVELDPWFALPQALRLREVTWDREFLFGRYTATLQLNRGYDDIIDEEVVHFWVLPWKLVAGIFFTIFIIFFLIRAFFRTFEFRRKS